MQSNKCERLLLLQDPELQLRLWRPLPLSLAQPNTPQIAEGGSEPKHSRQTCGLLQLRLHGLFCRSAFVCHSRVQGPCRAGAAWFRANNLRQPNSAETLKMALASRMPSELQTPSQKPAKPRIPRKSHLLAATAWTQRILQSCISAKMPAHHQQA